MSLPHLIGSETFEEARARCQMEEDRAVEKRLAHILWRNAKQLVSLLENEYGFGVASKDYAWKEDAGTNLGGPYEIKELEEKEGE